LGVLGFCLGVLLPEEVRESNLDTELSDLNVGLSFFTLIILYIPRVSSAGPEGTYEGGGGSKLEYETSKSNLKK